MALVIKGSSSGQVTVDVPAAAGTNTLTIPASTGTMALTSDLSSITSVGTLTSLTVSGDVTVDTNTLKVDSTNNRVGIGTTSPESGLHLTDGTNVIAPQNSNRTSTLIIEGGSETADLQFLTSQTHSHIFFGDAADANVGIIAYDHSNNSLQFTTNASERFRMESDGDFHADGDVIAFSTTVSDIALKTDIEIIPNALDKIDEVRGVTFTRHNGQKSAGIIAQELEKVLPEAVRKKKLALHDGKEYKTVEYDAIHGLLINCIKELKQEIEELKNAFTK